MSKAAESTTDPAIAAALAASHLGHLPPDLTAALLADGVRMRAPAGAVIRDEGQPGPHVDLVVSGLVRVYLAAPDGRTLTIRYCRRGALLGVLSLFVPAYTMPGGNQALVESQLLALRPATLRTLADTELTVARALLAELSQRVLSSAMEIRDRAFATVRQRVARHLLDLASEHQLGGELVAPVTHRELAEAAGSVREVVVRVLRDLREDGLVETRRDGIAILDPERLAAELLPGTVPRAAAEDGT